MKARAGVRMRECERQSERPAKVDAKFIRVRLLVGAHACGEGGEHHARVEAALWGRGMCVVCVCVCVGCGVCACVYACVRARVTSVGHSMRPARHSNLTGWVCVREYVTV